MPVYNPEYSNVNKVPLSLTGSKSYIIDEAHFTEQECNITADGTLTICCPVQFKEGFIFDGDICDIDGGATFKDFTATEGYYLEALASTCANPIARTRAVSYYTDILGPSLSTVFRNFAGTQGDAKLIINSTSQQPSLNPVTDNFGMIIEGGDLDRTKNIQIKTTGDKGGAIEMIATDEVAIYSNESQIVIQSNKDQVFIEADANIDLQAGTDVNIKATEKIEIETVNDKISIDGGTTIDITANTDVNIEADDVNILANELVSIDGGTNIDITANTDVNIDATTGDILLKSDAGNITLDAHDKLILKCDDFELDIADSYTLDVNGDILIKSDTGKIEIEAGTTIDLKANTDFNIEATGAITIEIPSGQGALTLKNSNNNIKLETDFQVTFQSNRGFGPNPTVPGLAFFTQNALGGMTLNMGPLGILKCDNLQTQKINGSRVNGNIPPNSKGSTGDTPGAYVFTAQYFYYCYANYNGVNNIWSRVLMDAGTW